MEELQQKSIEFIRNDLIPEMVHNRCFCAADSREFVEFDSVSMEPFTSESGIRDGCEQYRATVVVKFSGEPQSFSVVIKLLRDPDHSPRAYDAFLNEEMFYNKMATRFGSSRFSKNYASDMGRYGQPVSVLEDLEASGFRRATAIEMNEDHLRLGVEAIGRFHGRGLKLKAENFNAFREFYAKFLEVKFEDEAIDCYARAAKRTLERLKSQNACANLVEALDEKLGKDPTRTLRSLISEVNEDSTICHGHLSRESILFKYENAKPVETKVIDWQMMRYCSVGIDLGPILFGNLPERDLTTKLEEILAVYLEAVKGEFPDASVERLRKEFATKLLYVFFVLSYEVNTPDKKLVEMLRLFEYFGMFD